MVNYTSLTFDEQTFVIFYGAKNCYKKRLKNIKAIYKIMVSSKQIMYFDEDGIISDEFFKVAEKFAGTEVLIYHHDYYNFAPNCNIVCGDNNFVFMDEMFKDDDFDTNGPIFKDQKLIKFENDKPIIEIMKFVKMFDEDRIKIDGFGAYANTMREEIFKLSRL